MRLVSAPISSVLASLRMLYGDIFDSHNLEYNLILRTVLPKKKPQQYRAEGHNFLSFKAKHTCTLDIIRPAICKQAYHMILACYI
jgi:hypothetical protein